MCLLLGLDFGSFFFFKQKTVYEMRISDWSSDVCSSDLVVQPIPTQAVRVASVAKPVAGKAAAPRDLVSGNWVVQLGAYEHAAVARDGWHRISRVLPGFQGQAPPGVHFRGDGRAFSPPPGGGLARRSAERRVRREGVNTFRSRVAS